MQNLDKLRSNLTTSAKLFVRRAFFTWNEHHRYSDPIPRLPADRRLVLISSDLP